jgi:FkbM family methyltransferase
VRLELLFKPRALCERLASESLKHRRLGKLRGTVAERLQEGHIGSLELLEEVRSTNPRVIFDLGASVGTWSLLAKAVLPSAVIHAFEPLEFHCSKLEQAISDIPGIWLHKVAIGSRDGRSKMHVTSFSDASSLLEIGELTSEEFGIKEIGEVEVPITTLDGYVSRGGLPPPDLIKLDLQGYELEALLGGENCLKHATSVICEVSFREYYAEQPLFHDIVGFLANRGFHLEAFATGTPIGKRLSQADALFVRS